MGGLRPPAQAGGGAHGLTFVGARLIGVPFHEGEEGVAMGAGPSALLGDAPDVSWLAAPDPELPPLARMIEVDRRVARAAAEIVAAGAVPIAVAGNCNATLGVVAGAGPGLGVVWLDAHADFDTPDDNRSGFFDVMGLAVLTGAGFGALARSIPGWAPVDEADVVLAGVRDLDGDQRARVASSRLRVVPGAFALPALTADLDGLRARRPRVHLHVDLDTLDVAEGVVNRYAAPGGPSLATLLAALDAVFARFYVASAALTSYEPGVDADGRAGDAGRAVLARLVAGAAR
jgi:arginase